MSKYGRVDKDIHCCMIQPQARTGTGATYHGELRPSHNRTVSVKRWETPNSKSPWSSEGPLLTRPIAEMQNKKTINTEERDCVSREEKSGPAHHRRLLTWSREGAAEVCGAWSWASSGSRKTVSSTGGCQRRLVEAAAASARVGRSCVVGLASGEPY